MAIIKYGPFQEVEKFFDDWSDFGFMPAFRKHSIPAMDIYETDENVVVELQITKPEAEKVSISVVDGRTLKIEGKEEKKEERKDKNYYRKEIRRGQFTRTISLPTSIKEDEIKAIHKGGVLKITIPKTKDKEVKKINVEVE